MCLGRPSSSPDPERNSMSLKDPPLFSRLISTMFPSKKATVPKPKPQLDPENQNLFPALFTGAANVTYSKSESEQTAAKLWSIYAAEAERYDSALVTSWKGDMEGILIFSGLFSASLTAFLIESYKNLQPDSGDRTVQILSQISQQLSALSLNITLSAISASDTLVFQPTPASLVCNTLWFISLCLSITCALLATLVEQWARDFLHRSEQRPSPVRRARIVSFLYFGIRRFGLHGVVDVIPLLLHVALILFLAGLITFLLPINHMMAALISVVLVLFLVLYAILTLLPLIHLDCPYRTPFTGLFWNLLRRVRSRRNMPLPPGSANINDTMVQRAMEDSESRDQHAFIWTMDSLTDDNELLPFIEGIPEAIQGIHGFHLVNDYLFVPLLNQGSLGPRIGDIILSSGNMDYTDPRCSRGLLAAAKAIWALGMISGRTGSLFDHGGSVWFSNKIQSALDQPPRSVLPKSYRLAAHTAILYSRMNNLRNQIVQLLRAVECGHHGQAWFIYTIQNVLIMANANPIQRLSDSLHSSLESLKTLHSSTIVQHKQILSSMIVDDVWLEVNVSILVGFLLEAAESMLLDDEDLPYECVHTCFKIVPLVLVLDPAVPRMKRCLGLYTDYLNAVDPSRHSTVSGDMLGIHWIMRCFLCILPLLHSEDGVPIGVSYLTKCKDLQEVEFATQECDLPYLMDLLVAYLVLEPPDAEVILAAIRVVLILPRFDAPMNEWKNRDDLLWNYLVKHNLLSPMVPSVIPTLMILRKFEILASRPFEENQTDLQDLRGLGRLPSNNLLLQGLRESTDIRASQGVIIIVTDFLRGCLDPVRPVHMCAAFRQVSRWLPASLKDVDLPLVISLAGTCLLLAKKVVDDPDDRELTDTAAVLFLRLPTSPEDYWPPQATEIFKEAINMYLTFFDMNPDRRKDLEYLIHSLVDLTARWDAVGS